MQRTEVPRGVAHRARWKLVKIAGGMLNTHSKYGDCRMDIMAAHAGAAGLPAPLIAEMLDCATCDDALRILKESSLCTLTWSASQIEYPLLWITELQEKWKQEQSFFKRIRLSKRNEERPVIIETDYGGINVWCILLVQAAVRLT